MIDVPMNSVGGLIEDYKSAVASVVCVVAPVCDPLANKCPLVLAEPVVALLRLRVDRDLPSIWPLPIAQFRKRVASSQICAWEPNAVI